MRAKTAVTPSNSNNSSHSKVGKVSRSIGRREGFWKGNLGGHSTLIYPGEK